MASRYCTGCEIAYPVEPVFTTCAGCGGKTTYFSTLATDPEWPEKTTKQIELRESELGPEMKMVIAWRTERLMLAGLGYDDAMRLASMNAIEGGGFEVDVSRFAELVALGWTPEQAMAVLA